VEFDVRSQLEEPIFVRSSSLTFHSVASPGITALALSADDRSHIVSESYMVRPVKRLPS